MIEVWIRASHMKEEASYSEALMQPCRKFHFTSE
jgi:hypothetical protein